MPAPIAASLAAGRLSAADPYALLDHPEVRDELLPMLLEKAEALAAGRIDEIVQPARARMRAQLGEEIERLEDLQRINHHVRPEEIAERIAQQKELDSHLQGARLRLDAVRLIQCGPS